MVALSSPEALVYTFSENALAGQCLIYWVPQVSFCRGPQRQVFVARVVEIWDYLYKRNIRDLWP
jgi:hypothetical protein